MSPVVQDVSFAGGLLATLLIALEAGFRAGRRAGADTDGRASGQVGAIQGAILGLLGLLLAFSFAAAEARFLERQDLIVEEANAIGTAWLRADLIDEPYRSELRSALKHYTQQRIEISARSRRGVLPDDAAAVERLHREIWRAASTGAAARPAAIIAVLPPVNELIDLHSIQMAAARKHVPLPVLGLLIACSLLAIGSVGYGCGLVGQRRAPLTASLAILVGASLWITIDLDQPQAEIGRAHV